MFICTCSTQILFLNVIPITSIRMVIDDGFSNNNVTFEIAQEQHQPYLGLFTSMISHDLVSSRNGTINRHTLPVVWHVCIYQGPQHFTILVFRNVYLTCWYSQCRPIHHQSTIHQLQHTIHVHQLWYNRSTMIRNTPTIIHNTSATIHNTPTTIHNTSITIHNM